MASLFDSRDLVYARRTSGVGDLVGGGQEHWELSGLDGTIVATVEETDLTALRRAGRLLNNLFPDQQRRHLAIRDSSGRAQFEVLTRPPKPGLEYAEVRTADGAPAGSVRLIRPAGSDHVGLGFYDVQDNRLGEARYAQKKTARNGHRTLDLVAAGGASIGDLASTKTQGGSGPTGYQLAITEALSEPLRSLVYAAPVVWYFVH
jgi:hypothetical protein